MKVIIADDEMHICTLINHLIDWDSLGLTLLGIFGNGIDVLKQFEKEPADILICDIEMPGMSGLELIKNVTENYPACKCIIISGFRNFEYARTAMQYGITNYLLKPIDEEELNKTLKSVISSSKEVRNITSAVREQSIRHGLLDVLLLRVNKDDINAINEKYNYRLHEGLFRMFKVVFTGIDIRSDIMPKIFSIFSEIIKPKLMDFCYEAEIFRLSSSSELVFINYNANSEKFMKPMIDRIFRETITELMAKTQCKFFIGVGMPVNHISHVNISYQSAKYAVCKRMSAKDKLIYYIDYDEFKAFQEEKIDLTPDNRQKLLNIIENIDLQGISKWLDDSFKENERVFCQNPYLIFEFSNKIVNLFILAMDNLEVPVNESDEFMQRISILFDNCISKSAFKERLKNILITEMNNRLSQKKKNMSVYVQQAKNYIDKHYAENITLEHIAEKLYINPVYLSTVFKNETRMNFSKYLTFVRIEKAKEMLRNSEMNLKQVAHSVGYNSTHYFTNRFKSVTGIRPLEYRRLHMHEIGE